MGACMYMATYKLSSPRRYWQEKIRIITDHFTVGRFEELRSSIHFNSDIGLATNKEESGQKVQPLIDRVNARLHKLKPSTVLCIDEMMVNSKSRFGPKLYHQGKPHPWGYKVYGLSDPFAICYNTQLHTGSFPQVEGFPDLGSTGNRVLSLVQSLPKDENFDLYMDNYFTSIPLLTELAKIGIQSMGTIRLNNAPGFSKMCMPDRELKSLGNRSFVEYWVTFDTCEAPGIRIVRWDDNNVFNLASTFGSGYPTVGIVRWHRDKTKKSHKTQYNMPGSIGQYNKSMGGIDKMDMLIALHPCKFKVRRWPMKIFFHLLDLTVVNAWLLYQIEFKRTHVGQKHLDLYQFKRSISEVWIKNNSSRPVATRGEPRRVPELRHGAARPAHEVPLAIRFNPMWHLPFCFSGYYDRHRCAQCKAQTNVFCMKCEVFLCCSYKRNCYILWHTEHKGRLVAVPECLIVPDNETENVPDDETENDFDSDTQSVHSIDSQNTQTVPYDDNDAE